MRKRVNRDPDSSEPLAKKLTTLPSLTDIKGGAVLTDISGKSWTLGKPIGTGGFGQIYLACDNDECDAKNNKHVVKVEAHASGPLFVEINCYLRIARLETIEKWKEDNEVEHLGMPHYVASGSHVIGKNKYRFLILPKFEKDLEQIFQSKKCRFNLKTVLTIAIQTVDTLRYIHSKGYIHSDIKASNILFNYSKLKKQVPSPVSSNKRYLKYNRTPIAVQPRKLTKGLKTNWNTRSVKDDPKLPLQKPNNLIDQIYLLDYGLATKYRTSNGEHKEFCIDMRKAHAGTVLFCSRDAHEGAQSRRSDLECLGFNIIYWLTSNLPWNDVLNNPELVHKKKSKCVKNIKEFLNLTFNYECPKFLFEYFDYLKTLDFESEPDYNHITSLFKNAIKEYGYKNNLLLDFDNLEGWGSKQKKTTTSENERLKYNFQKFNRSPLASNLPARPILRQTILKQTNGKLRWSKILMDPEIIIKNSKNRERKRTESSESNLPSSGILNLDLSSLNPTMAMIEVFNKTMERLNHNGGCAPKYKSDEAVKYLDGYNSAMMEVHNRMKERQELENEKSCVLGPKSKRGNKQKNKKTEGNSVVYSPKCTRFTKSNSKAIPPEKKTPKKSKVVPLTRTYSLRRNMLLKYKC